MGDRATSEGRYGYWFPLVLLGFGLLGQLGWESVAAREDIGWTAYASLPAESGHVLAVEQYSFISSLPLRQASSPVRDWPWAALITATLVGAMAWYAWRARRAGGSVRPHVVLAVGGGLAVPACYVIAGAADAIGDPAGLVRSVGLPLLGLGALTGAWAYLGRGPWRGTAATISAACLVAGVGTVLGAWSPGLVDPVLIAAGLLVLARYERSLLLAVVAGAVLVALVVFPGGTLSMLIPAVILLATAIVALVRRTGASAQA